MRRRINKMRPIEQLKNANEYKIHTVEFTIPIAGTPGLNVRLSAPDAWAIREEQKKIQKIKFLELKAEGLHKQSIDEDEWVKERNEYLKTIQTKTEKEKEILLKEYDKNKPESLAHFLALDASRTRTVFELMPKMLRDVETGELVCQTADDIEYFKQLMKSNSKLITLFTENWIKLSKMIEPETGGTEKNSGKPESGESTNSN